MAWWDRLAGIGTFIGHRQKAREQIPQQLGRTSKCVAEHIVNTRVYMPFMLTLDEYAAFLVLSSDYLDQKKTGGPLECYHLAATVLMWHAAIWDYIGQTINDFCDRLKPEKDITFWNATDPKRLKGIDPRSISPIPKDFLEGFAARLRDLYKKTSASRGLRHTTMHRYHIANTYDLDLAALLAPALSINHARQLADLLDAVRMSYITLIKAQQEIATFLSDPQVRAWQPEWYIKEE